MRHGGDETRLALTPARARDELRHQRVIEAARSLMPARDALGLKTNVVGVASTAREAGATGSAGG